MRAMRVHALGSWGQSGQNPPDLRLDVLPDPEPGPGEVLIAVEACGVCRTELDEIEGRAPPTSLPRVLGHQVVGDVVGFGPGVAAFDRRRVGVAWIFGACEQCDWCLSGYENLCPSFVATGRDVDGGYAELMVAPADFVHPLPENVDGVRLAPLLCAGAIGYRSLRLTGLLDAASPRKPRLGLAGFGASAHLVLRLVTTVRPSAEVYVFTRSDAERAFALELGATWAGDIGERAPERLHAAIDTTPAHKPLLEVLPQLLPGGRLVVNAISKQASDLRSWLDFDFHRDLWLEREIKSVANVTRKDVREFVEIATRGRFLPEVTEYSLEEAPRALQELAAGNLRGAKVLRIGRPRAERAGESTRANERAGR